MPTLCSLFCPICGKSREIKPHYEPSSVRACFPCASKIFTQARKDKAKENAHLRQYGITGSLTCPDCGETRVARYHKVDRPGRTHGLCRPCSMRRRYPATAEACEAGFRRYLDSPEGKARKSELGKASVARMGGVIPNAVHFTNGSTAGEKNVRWKGGITSDNAKVRSSTEYKEWIKAVFARDNYTCQICQQRGGKLHAHHIESFSERRELRTDINNGLTACLDCHREILHRGSFRTAPMPIEDIRELQRMVSDGSVSIDWREAA